MVLLLLFVWVAVAVAVVVVVMEKCLLATISGKNLFSFARFWMI